MSGFSVDDCHDFAGASATTFNKRMLTQMWNKLFTMLTVKLSVVSSVCRRYRATPLVLPMLLLFAVMPASLVAAETAAVASTQQAVQAAPAKLLTVVTGVAKP